MEKLQPTRRRILRIAPAVTLAVAAHIFLGWQAKYSITKPESIPAGEVHSPYYGIALDSIKKRIQNPQIATLARGVLDNLDRQAINSVKIEESQLFPGVKYPWIEIDLNRTATDLGFRFNPSEKAKTDIFFIPPGFSDTKGGNFWTAFDIVIERAFRELPKVVGEGASRSKIVMAGSPHALWGETTTAWENDFNENRFNQFGLTYAEFLSKMVQGSDITATRLVLHGMSTGATIAKATGEALPASTRQQLRRLQLLMDEPVGLNSTSPLLLNAIQIPVGFLLESFIRGSYTPRGQSQQKFEPKAHMDTSRILVERGLINLSPEEKSMKFTWDEVKSLVAGTQTTDNVRGFSRESLWGLASFRASRLTEADRLSRQDRNVVTGSGNTLRFYINTTHIIDRFSIHMLAHWENSLQRCLRKS